MKANINNNQIYSRLPKIWGNIVNFDKSDEAVIYAEGFRDVVRPEFDSDTQVLGALFFDEQNDYFTYPIIDLTEEEIRQRTVPQTITPAQVRVALAQLQLLETVEQLISTVPLAFIWWEYALEIRRDNQYVEMIGAELGWDSNQIDQFFIQASVIT